MKLIVLFFFIIAPMAHAVEGIKVSPPGEGLKKGFTYSWEWGEGCDAPESVYYDPDTGYVFVSNIIGDGKGLQDIRKRRKR